MSLDNLRKQIDGLDDDIVRLIAERVRVAGEIGKIKKIEGLQIEDTGREQIVFRHITEIAEKENISTRDIEGIYRKIISLAKSVEGIAVGFQGEKGAYSEEAAMQYFGTSIDTRPYSTVDDVFAAVENDELPYGIVPIENSLEGSVSRTYDMLLDSGLQICGETEFKVVHCLIVNPETSPDMLKTVYSHPQALGQCHAYLKRLNCELIPTYDTAGSVKMIKEKKLIDAAAVAGNRAADIYGMKVLTKDIADNPNNFTRFFVLSKQAAQPTGNDKTSIVFSVQHRPGSLIEFLNTLAAKGINLTKIESRPTRHKPWEYNFYLDFEGHAAEDTIHETLRLLEGHCYFLKVIGSYPKAKKP